MLTIFSIPKPFQGHHGVIQTNAIRSWIALRPACEVILFGNEEGIAEIACELGIRHIPDVDCNEYGTPLLNSALSLAQNIAKYQLMCYVNADIILLSDFITAIGQIQKSPFLIVGRRTDLKITQALNFNALGWELRLCSVINEQGILHDKTGQDYFVFTRGLFKDIPPFAVGRFTWDNWLIYYTRFLRIPVIDATGVVTAIHQNHDYSYHSNGWKGLWEGPEAQRNLELSGGTRYCFSLSDATHILTQNGLKTALSFTHIWRRFYTLAVFYPFLNPLWLLLNVLLKISRPIREKIGLIDDRN